MSIKNIIMTSCSRILKQQRRVVWESTQIGYQNNESFKKALRWAIETMKMSKLRISSNDKRGVVWESTQVGYWNDKRHCQKTATVRSMKAECWAHNLLKYDLYWNNCFNSCCLTRMQSLHQQHDFCVSWLSSIMWHDKFWH